MRNGWSELLLRTALLWAGATVVAWGGPVYNITELRAISGCAFGNADLAKMFYADFRYAPPAAPLTDPSGPLPDPSGNDDALLPLPSWRQEGWGEPASLFGEAAPAYMPATPCLDADDSGVAFPVNSLAASDTEGILYTPAFVPDSIYVYRSDGETIRLSCDAEPSGFAITLCARPEAAGRQPEPTEAFARGAHGLSFDCAVYRESESLPAQLCARWDRGFGQGER